MKWKLENLYESVRAWEKDVEALQSILNEIPKFKGKLGDFETFKTYYTNQRDVAVKAHKLYQYAALKSDLNKRC